MDDYILRDAAKVKIWKCPETLLPTQEAEDYLIAQIDSIHAADVRPVVRCGECIRKDICRSSNIWAVSPDDNWFCADGERRDGGTP